jgi:cyclohexa-1,5-dienecarbonyl-CoA hydratase
MTDRIQLQSLDDGAFWRATFGGTKGNILDRVTLGELSATFRRAQATPTLKAICLEGAGAHFSFGASVQEHLPAEVPAMLAALRGLVLDLLDSGVVVMAAVRGQ